jgi:hypothetical protein
MENETLGNSQAFASIAVEKNQTFVSTGLTKREYFAAMAMQAIISSPQGHEYGYEETADYAIEHADALITALNN